MTERIFDTTVQEHMLAGMRLARKAIAHGKLIVIPTDTVYGIAADAFNREAVKALISAKGRTASSPPPVLIPGIPTLDALAQSVPDEARKLVAQWWPGPLTLIVMARTSLDWDVSETKGTVALRMPADMVARELLSETGPLAVSSANITAQPPAVNVDEAFEFFGDAVEVYLGSGARKTGSGNESSKIEKYFGQVSTIVDVTAVASKGPVRVLRVGAISVSEIQETLGSGVTLDVVTP